MESRRKRLEELERELGSIDPTDYEALVATQARIDAERAEIDGLETAWLEASEQLEG